MSQSSEEAEYSATHWTAFVAGLRAFVARRVPRQDADDVAQDLFLRLHANAGSLRDSARLQSWVFGIARRTVADYYRSQRPDAIPADDDLPDERRSDVRGFGHFEGDHSTHEEVLTWLRPTAEELPEPYRQALLATDFDGKTQSELAAELGLSVSGVKSRVQRARAMLGKSLRRCCEIELGPEGRVVDFEPRECDC